MNGNSTEENETVVRLHSFGTKYHRVRITANPADSEMVEVAESLLSKCELSRCESSNEEGVSVWSVIVPEELVDEALRGIAVVVPVDYEFFCTMEGGIFLVTETGFRRLAGFAEEAALCWGDNEDPASLEGEITRTIQEHIEVELQHLDVSETGDDADLLAEIEKIAWSKVDLLECGEEDVRDAVSLAYQEVIGKTEIEGGEVR